MTLHPAALSLCLAAFLGACGGGGSEETTTSGAPLAAALEEKKAVPALPTVLPGDPATRSVGALPNGRVTVAWVSGFEVYSQRYDKTGHAVGSAVRLPIPPHEVPAYQTPPAVVVQANGDVAVLYQRVGPPVGNNPPYSLHIGVYLQRFGADGTQLQGETELVSMHQYDQGAVGKGRQDLVDLRLLPVSDGSFVASWGVRYGGCLGCGSVDLFMQRFDRGGEPSTGVFVPVRNVLWIAIYNSSFEWTADDKGGFTVTGTYYDRFVNGTAQPLPVQESTHYPKGNKAVRVAKPPKGT
jgi:hypothetical protein